MASKETKIKAEFHFDDPTTLVQYIYNEEKGMVEASQICCSRVKDTYMHLLERLNEDFDDDLFSDALALLGCL